MVFITAVGISVQFHLVQNNNSSSRLTMSHEAVACCSFDAPDPTHVLSTELQLQSGTVFHDAWRKCVIAWPERWRRGAEARNSLNG